MMPVSEIKPVMDARILIVDDDNDILTAGKLLLKRHFSHLVTCSAPQDIPEIMSQNRFDAVMLDMNFGPGESSGKEGYRWLQAIIKIDPQSVVVMITAHGGIDVAIEAIKLGATDFIAKPWQNQRVVATLTAAVLLGKTRNEAAQLRHTNQLLAQDTNKAHHQPLLAKSPAMQQVLSLISRSAPTDANVLILGENGTGKDLVARELHRQSLRCEQIFMSVDLGAISETLFESELFGHTKGAFTGANTERMGRLQAANGGTLFLDEIGNLPLHLQAKLLTVLEQRKVTPLGSNKALSFDVRIIAATNVPKHSLSQEKRFRQDLLFRLNTVEIAIPALRERVADIADITFHYIALYCKKYAKPEKQLGKALLGQIENYSWPGNVRALRHGVERAVILSESEQLSAQDFQLEQEQPLPMSENIPAAEAQPTETATSEPPLKDSGHNLEQIEKAAIEGALRAYRYNISHSAKALGLTRAALYRRMEKHGL
jgi:DNA-binding NtrC family response regulator